MDLGRDRDLVARFQNGDPEAFDDLYRCYFNRLRRYCQRQTNDLHEAEEVAQEAFVKALRSMDSLQGERRFYPWMTVIAKRIVIDRHRKMSRVELTEEPDLGSVDPDHDHLFAEVDAAQVRAALDNVGPRHREVLLMRETESMSYADIADRLDVPVTTVEALLHRARKALRREYAAVAGPGERRAVWGLPVLGWIGSRAARIRTRLDDRWAELVAIAAPVTVGAVTAAFVLLPADAPETVDVATASSAPTTVIETVPTAPEPTPTTAAPTTAAPTTTPPTTAAPTTTTTTPPPAIDAGPVDIYVGPEGTEVARAKAEEMPLNGTLGETTGGIDPAKITDDVSTAVEDLVSLVFGRMETP